MFQERLSSSCPSCLGRSTPPEAFRQTCLSSSLSGRRGSAPAAEIAATVGQGSPSPGMHFGAVAADLDALTETGTWGMGR